MISSVISLRTGSRERRGAVRVPGLPLLFAIVFVGLLTGAGFYRMQRARIGAALATEVAAVPTTPAERLAVWLRYGGPQIHHRLSVVGRFAAEMPWLVTHAVARSDGPPELWGIDCQALSVDMVRLEGMHVVVDLPHPRALGRSVLEGDQANRVLLVAPGAELDPAQRLRELVLHLLEGLPGALERDIPGAALEIRVAAE